MTHVISVVVCICSSSIEQPPSAFPVPSVPVLEPSNSSRGATCPSWSILNPANPLSSRPVRDKLEARAATTDGYISLHRLRRKALGCYDGAVEGRRRSPSNDRWRLDAGRCGCWVGALWDYEGAGREWGRPPSDDRGRLDAGSTGCVARALWGHEGAIFRSSLPIQLTGQVWPHAFTRVLMCRHRVYDVRTPHFCDSRRTAAFLLAPSPSPSPAPELTTPT